MFNKQLNDELIKYLVRFWLEEHYRSSVPVIVHTVLCSSNQNKGLHLIWQWCMDV